MIVSGNILAFVHLYIGYFKPQIMKKYILILVVGFFVINANAQNPNHLYSSIKDAVKSKQVVYDFFKISSVDSSMNLINYDKKQTPIEVLFYGSGGFQNVLGESLKSDNLSGAIGLTLIKPEIHQFYFSATLSKSDPVIIISQKDFGNALIMQNVTGNSLSFGGVYYLGKFGLNADFQFTNSSWQINDTIYGADPISIKLQIAVLPFPELSNWGDNTFDLFFNLGYSSRILLNDITFSKNKDLRKRIFNTEKYSFHGLELDINFVINKKTTIYAEVPWMFCKDEIDGLTGPRVNIGARITGDLIRLKK